MPRETEMVPRGKRGGDVGVEGPAVSSFDVPAARS